MSTDPPAADLGAQEAPWLARLRRLANMPMLADASRISVGLADLQATIDHIDAQAARLANQAEAAKVVDALVRERDAQAARLAVVEQALARWCEARGAEGVAWDSEGEDWPARMAAAQQARQQAEEALLAVGAVGAGEA